MNLDRIIKRAQDLIDKYESKEAAPSIVKVDDISEVDGDFNGLVLVLNHVKFVNT